MAVPDSFPLSRVLLLASVIPLLGCAGAASAPAPPAAAGTSEASRAGARPASVEPAPPEAPTPAPERSAGAPRGEEPRGPEPVVIDPGGGGAGDANPLAAAAAASRQRRARTGAPVVRIDDGNLAEHATGRLTVSGPDSALADDEAGQPAELASAEAYWRQRMLSLRQEWQRTAASIGELEGEAEQWRRRFYAEDDPYHRDARIKPHWDRALGDLQAARERVEEIEAEVALSMEEGHRAGALPGWLREGLELEPETRSYHHAAVGEPELAADGMVIGEPDVIDEDRRNHEDDW